MKASRYCIARLAALSLGIALCGCTTLLPTSRHQVDSAWTSYERRAAQAAYDAALAGYEETVLPALTQVADVLRALEHDAVVLQVNADAESAAAENLRLARINYEAGTTGYLDILVADSQLAQARLARLGASAQQLQDTVALYAALGGGWWNGSGLPTASSSPP